MTAETNSHYPDPTEQLSFEAQFGRHADVAQQVDEYYADVPVLQVGQESTLPEAGGNPMQVLTPWHNDAGKAVYGPLPAGMLVERLVGVGEDRQARRGYIDEGRRFNPIPQDENGRDVLPSVVTDRFQQIEERMVLRREQRRRDERAERPAPRVLLGVRTDVRTLGRGIDTSHKALPYTNGDARQLAEGLRSIAAMNEATPEGHRAKLFNMAKAAAGALALSKFFGGNEGRHAGKPQPRISEQGPRTQRTDGARPGETRPSRHRGRHAGKRRHVR